MLPYRQPLIILTLLLLALSHYLHWKKSRAADRKKSAVILWISTVISLSMIAYVLYRGWNLTL